MWYTLNFNNAPRQENLNVFAWLLGREPGSIQYGDGSVEEEVYNTYFQNQIYTVAIIEDDQLLPRLLKTGTPELLESLQKVLQKKRDQYGGRADFVLINLTNIDGSLNMEYIEKEVRHHP